MTRAHALLAGVTVLLTAAFAAAQTPLLGPEGQVNTFPTGNQRRPAVAMDPSGAFVVAWQSYGQDYDRFGVFANGPSGPPTPTPTPTTADCGATPVGGCATPGKAKILIKDKSPAGASAKDKVIYKWLKGPAVNQSDFGDPVSGGTDILICVYANNAFVARFTAPGGGTCGAAPCWKAIGTKGYSYKDASATNNGLQKVQLKGGGAWPETFHRAEDYST